jgi:3-phenylpropionate/cinnamic acid dioxygenase small subunit
MSALNERLIGFVLDEAQLLDEGRYGEWLDLFTDDARYWMPVAPGQTDPLLHNSIMYEDKLLLRIRIERLSGARTYSEQPRSRCHHLLQTPRVVQVDEAKGEYRLRTAFHYVETRLDRQTLYAGWATHHLVSVNEALRIQLKRIDLVNCDAAFGNISLFM